MGCNNLVSRSLFGRLISGFYLFASLLFLSPGCSRIAPDNRNAVAALQDELPGKWRAIEVTIHITDSLAVAQTLQINEAALREKPIIWEFVSGNRYNTISGAEGTQSRGIWNAFSDTLMMIEPRATYQYQVAFTDKEAIFRATLDWDGDGAEDDNYVGRFVKE